MFDIKKSANTKIYVEMFILKFVNDYVNVDKKLVVENNKKIENSHIINQNQKIENNSDYTIVDENEEVDDNFDFDSEFGDDDSLENDGLIAKNTPVEKEISDFSNSSMDDTVSNLFDEKKPKILNMDQVMSVRVNNTLALANKSLLNSEIEKFKLLNDYTFDQEIGYIVCSLLDSKIRAVSPDNIIISFEYESNVEQNLLILDKIIDVYNKITSSNKNIAIITDSKWESVKNEYINNLKKNIKYEVLEEPKLLFEEIKKDDIIVSSAVELFGDIVEVE